MTEVFTEEIRSLAYLPVLKTANFETKDDPGNKPEQSS